MILLVHDFIEVSPMNPNVFSACVSLNKDIELGFSS